ncbi:IS630 family transposase, partial [Larkinella soli]|uniref:IS630 family transposase n=1 Tax=Larkinella soli TaxID=1770527 RepID=UPI000FFB10DF
KSKLKPWLKKQWCIGQLNGEYLAKREDVLLVYSQPEEANRARICFDERPCQLLNEVVEPIPMKPRQVSRYDYEYVREGTAVVLLAYDLDRGLRYTQVRQQRTKADYAQFMQELIQTYYTQVAYVDVVQDNLNTHRYGSFYEHLPLEEARSLSRKVVFHYTPKHGSWLNMAEMEFSALARQCLNRRIGSLTELSKQVSLWTQERNARQVKVHWSFTVSKAEEKLKRWYEQVNPANKPPDSNN